MTWFKVLLTVLFSFNAAFSIAGVGLERKPLKSQDAVVSLLFSIFLIVGIWIWL